MNESSKNLKNNWLEKLRILQLEINNQSVDLIKYNAKE